jgi:aminopeptidase N
MKKVCRLFWLFILLPFVAGCALSSTPPPMRVFTPTDPPPTATEFPWTPTSVRLPTATSLPTAAPTQAPTATPTPLPAWLDLTPQKQAMRPEFYADVESQSRLPLYDIEARLDLSQSEPLIAGVERLAFWNTTASPLAALVFRLYPNTRMYNARLSVSRALINGRETPFRLLAENTALQIDLTPALPPGERVLVELTFQTAFPRNNQSGYHMLTEANGVVVLNDFFPLLAVQEKQGWNSEAISMQGDAVYSAVSFFQVRLTAPEGMVVATGGVASKGAASGGNAIWSCVSGPARGFSVVMSREFRVAQEVVGGVTVRSFYLSKDEVGGKALLKVACDALTIYAQKIGPYPYSEFDVVEAPIGAGGMESSGLIMIKDEHYTLEAGYAEFVVAHEVAHQWWYGLVGNNQVAEPWVDEALANYTAMFYYQELYPGERAEQAYRWYLADPYQRVVEGKRDMPVNLPSASYRDSAYYEVVYAKGALFYHALRQRLGDAKFLAVLGDYAREYRYKLASSAELLAFWQNRAGQPIDDLIEKWVIGPK